MERVNREALTVNQGDRCASTTSEKFAPICTINLVEKAESFGWQIEDIQAQRLRNNKREGYQKHCVVMSHSDLPTIDQTSLRLRIVGANDGSTANLIDLAYYRAICANLVYADAKDSLASYRVIHRGKHIQSKIDRAIANVLEQAPNQIRALDKMKSTNLSSDQIDAFKERAFRLRFPDTDRFKRIPGTFNPARRADFSADLWTVCNRFQEILIRGLGRYYIDRASTRRYASGDFKKIRKLSGLDSQQRINGQLLRLAQEYIQ